MNAKMRAAAALLGAAALTGPLQFAHAAQTASAGGLSLTWLSGSPATSTVTASLSGIDWSCFAEGCRLASAPRIDFVFGAGPSGTRLLTEEKAIFEFSVARSSELTLVDPQGQAHSLLPLLGQWTFGVDVQANQAPASAQINVAQGRFDFEASVEQGLPWSWAPDRLPETVGLSAILDATLAVRVGAYIPSGLIGAFTFGPAASGIDAVMPVGDASVWQLGTQVFSPYYALPSSSNPRCTSLSCMDFAPAVLTTGGYRFSVATQLAPAVPEPSVAALSALGLAVGSVLLRRRQRAA